MAISDNNDPYKFDYPTAKIIFNFITYSMKIQRRFIESFTQSLDSKT